MRPLREEIGDADDEAAAILERIATGTGASADEVAWAREWVRLTGEEKAGRLAEEVAA